MNIGAVEKRVVALLVEDNRADVFLIQEAIDLHRLPLDLHVVRDGEQAYEFIEMAENDPEHFPRPDIVILDLNLPRRSGKEVLKRLRQSERCSTVPVVIVTSSDLSNDRRELSALGANRYFRKPSSYEEFLKVGEVLKELLEEQKLKELS
jgi:chemotaxis family two-component system response regulator Rcp1